MDPTYALITGASSGIGREFARRYAATGHGLVLVARREAELTALADELAAAYSVPSIVVPVDLSEPDGAARVFEAIDAAGIDLGVVVNSAGFGTAGPHGQTDPERLHAQAMVNVVALSNISAEAARRLSARGAGTLVNVASTAAYQPVPGMAVYGASKAYVRSLTEALWAELRPHGVKVLCLSPGPTDTGFFEAAGSDAFKLVEPVPVEGVVAAALRHLDKRDPGPSMIIGLGNAVQSHASRFVPTRLTLAVATSLANKERS